MVRSLWRGGRVLTPHHPAATALVVTDGVVEHVGDEVDGTFDEIHDLGGALVTPAFVDAHVHLTATGLAYQGLDLSGCRSGAEALAAVADRVRDQPTGPVIGHGWDETTWPDALPPLRADVDRVAGSRLVYLARVDLHAGVVSTAMLDATPGVTEREGFDPSGHLVAHAHDAVRTAAYAMLTDDQRRVAQRIVRARAAAHGVALVHEMAGPDLSSAEDLLGALALSEAEPGPEIVGYWGELGGIEKARELGALGAGGDIFADGTIGSHTACVRRVYDDLDSRGAGFLTAEQVRDHVVACVDAGLQAGFHAIGDASVDTVLAGFEAAAERVGAARVRAGRHRIEHLEMTDLPMVRRVAALGLFASVQPAFDAEWGGPEGLYEQRLGAERARTMNPFGPLQSHGVPLVFGSDTPVTPIDPWAAVRAAVHHHNPAHRIDAASAFAAHTEAGWRAAGRDGHGRLVPGAPATFAVWSTGELGADGLPDLDPDADLPECLSTVRAGSVIHRR